MKGSVETAKRVLGQGNCCRVMCVEEGCPLNYTEHSCHGNGDNLNTESVRKLQEFIKENEKMLDLTKNQILDPPVKCWVRSSRSSEWRETKLYAAIHHGFLAAPYLCSSGSWPICTLTDPTVPQYRHLNSEELSKLVGTVLVTKDRGFHILATAFNPVSKEVFLGNEWCTADQLLDRYLRLDGSPVGVLIK